MSRPGPRRPGAERRLDLIVPAHDEAAVLVRSVQRLYAAATELFVGGSRGASLDWRVVVVENGSRDDTAAVAERLDRDLPRCRAIRLPEAGRGRALRHVWCREPADLSLYMDADLATDLSALPPALERLLAGADVVVGSRRLAPRAVRRSLRRRLLSRGYGLVARALLGPSASGDLQCGFKGIRVARLRPLIAACRSSGWFFDTEMVVLARRAGLRVEELPVTWTESPRSSVVVRSAVPEVVRDLLELRGRLARASLAMAAAEAEAREMP